MPQLLIVDDEPLVRTRLAALLRTRGHSIAEAQDGTEAQIMLMKGKFDGVITDLIMPNGHGFGLIEFCRAYSGALAVVAMSSKGNPQFDYLSYAAECGADFGFHKDASLEQVLAKIDRLLAGDKIECRTSKRGPVLWPAHMMRAPAPSRHGDRAGYPRSDV